MAFSTSSHASESGSSKSLLVRLRALLRLTPAGQGHGYRADVDGLRAVAILLVVGYHYFPNHMPGGFAGVDVFFVISGYLITGILLDSIGAKSFSMVRFLSRRALRLFPALITLLACLIGFAWFTFTSAEYESLGKHVAAAALYLSNFILWTEAGYFDESALYKPLLHLWSLAIEEQYYLVWPLVLLLLVRRTKWPLAPIALLAVVSFVLNLHALSVSASLAFYMPYARAWELLLGSVLAYARWSGRLPQNGVFGENAGQGDALLSFAGLGLIAFAAFALDDKTPYPGFNALLPTLGAALVIAASPDCWPNRRMLASPPMVWIGLISYPLYLWHWMLLSVAATLGSNFPVRGTRIALLGLALVLSWATCRFIETPLRRRGGPRLALALLAVLLLTGAAGAAIFAGKGLPGRSGIAEVEARLKILDEEVRRGGALFDNYPQEACRAAIAGSGWCHSANNEPPSVALIGDSHAHHFFPGLAEAYISRGENLALLGSAGCPPLLEITSRVTTGGNDWCHKGNDFLAQVAASPSIHTVILAANWHLYMVGTRFSDAPDKSPYWTIGDTSGGAGYAVFRRQLEATLRLLTGSGKTVILIKQIPEIDYNPRSCLVRSRSFSVARACSIDAGLMRRYLDGYETDLDKILAAFPQVRVLNPAGLLCDAKECRGLHEGQPVYRDQVHLSRYGSRLVARHWLETGALDR
ncbi:MAG: acyltransferase family protein [Pseudomonadota bacterium]|nr:acyltransferase family protein [Pseudomonadota bacterium]